MSASACTRSTLGLSCSETKNENDHSADRQNNSKSYGWIFVNQQLNKQADKHGGLTTRFIHRYLTKT